jgi:hypothetical protein
MSWTLQAMNNLLVTGRSGSDPQVGLAQQQGQAEFDWGVLGQLSDVFNCKKIGQCRDSFMAERFDFSNWSSLRHKRMGKSNCNAMAL